MSSSSIRKNSSQPLRGVRVLVTRARGQAETLSGFLRAQGAEVIEIPVLEIVVPRSWKALDEALQKIAQYDWLILTSANGVDTLITRMWKLRIPLRSLRHLQVAAIGPATRAALEGRGIRVLVTPTKYVAESVAKALKNKVCGRRVLLVRAALAREVLPKELRRAGAQVTVATAYETRAPRDAISKLQKFFGDLDKKQSHPSPKSGFRMGHPLWADHTKRPVVVTCTSSSAATNYLELTQRIPAARKMVFASIGPITSETLRKHGIEPATEARSYTAQGLTEAIVRWAKNQGRADL